MWYTVCSSFILIEILQEISANSFEQRTYLSPLNFINRSTYRSVKEKLKLVLDEANE